MSIQAMNTAIKNNNLMRLKRDKFQKTLGGYGSKEKTEYNLQNASTKQLNHIRKRMQKERKIRLLKVSVVSSILFLVLIYFLILNASGIREHLWY